MSTNRPVADVRPNGAALAAFLAAGIGSFTMGFVSLLDAIGLLPVPALYDPAGGVTGRTTLAVLVWLITWAILHWRWKDRDLQVGRVHLATILLTVTGVLLALPPAWSLFQ